MSNALRRVVVDLTPVIPGGENGGAKIFVFELMRGLAELAPTTEFVLLTQASTHEELRTLERDNLRCLMILGPKEEGYRRDLPRLAARVLPYLPRQLRNLVSRVGYSLNVRLKRGRRMGLLRSLQADLLYCPFTAPTYFEPGVPTVCTVHDVQTRVYPEFFAIEDVAHRNRVFAEACSKATVIAAVSDYSRQAVIGFGAIDPSRVRTIHHRFARRFASHEAAPSDLSKEWRLVPGKYLIYPANFWRHKNHEMLLVAFGMACSGGMDPAIKLVCTGAPGERQTWLRQCVVTMGLADRVIFPGFVAPSVLAQLMSQCRAMVFPSLFEGFGLPVIEAMASGIPVACSNTTSLPEVASDAAILFDPRIPTQIEAAMKVLVEDDALCERLARAGLVRSEEFSDPARMAREYFDLFLHACANMRHENFLTGTFVDGWAGPTLNIHVVQSPGGQTLELDLFAPAWLPQKKYALQVLCNGETVGERHRFLRDEVLPLRIPVGNDGGSYQLTITPTIVPQAIGLGADMRELSVMLKRCSIVDHAGGRVELFPENV